QSGPSVLRERDDGRAVLELDRLNPDATGRMLAPAPPEEFVQHVIDEDAVRLEVPLDMLADRLHSPRRAIGTGRGPSRPQRHDENPLLLLLSHGLTPSACSVARN